MRTPALTVLDRGLTPSYGRTATKVEHASAKDLIEQLEDANPENELYDAKVTVLGEYIKHHVKEEHNEIFPKVRGSDMDLVALGEQLKRRKSELAQAAAE